MEESIKEIVEFIKNASPQVWAAAMRQVNIGIVQNLLGLLCAAFLYFAGKRISAKAVLHEDDDFLWHIGGCVVFAIAIIVVSCCIFNLVKLVGNPEYAAIEYLTELFKTK